jgi:hypothetical protein
MGRLLVADEWHAAIRMYSLNVADLGVFTSTGLNHAMDILIVPEPGAWALLGTGLIWLGLARRKGAHR